MEKTTTATATTSIINKGTGAGGANTNFYGKRFEKKTKNENRLLENGYIKCYFTEKTTGRYYLLKTLPDKTIVFVSQNSLKLYIKKTYKIDLFRCPDEAYIIEYKNENGNPTNLTKNKILILEKKEQKVEGSVETKLWSGPSLKREYELALENQFTTHYGFCVNAFLKNKITSDKKKYTILHTILRENNIAVLYGDDDDYFVRLDEWMENLI